MHEVAGHMKREATDNTKLTDHPLAEPDPVRIEQVLADIMVRSFAKAPDRATKRDWFGALSKLVRGYLAELWIETRRRADQDQSKVVYYLSMEFLLGRSLRVNLLNLGIQDACAEALKGLGIELDELYELEFEAALGNGGLGRLAACFIESLTTQDYPTYGYGIRYVYGMFRQRIQDGWQVEQPEVWLRAGDVWEFPRYEAMYPIRFGGRVAEYRDQAGVRRFHWVETDDIMAMGHDMMVSGWRTNTCNSIRLWSAKSTQEFDLRYFHEGDYEGAVRDKNESENLSRVLYPDDSTQEGRELRLKQEYFFSSASLQDILARHEDSLETLPDRVAIQLNDTHPVLAIPELMRLLMDTHELDWEKAWDITTRTFSYTNHTLLPEALETWPVGMIRHLLPRHLEIVFEINRRFIEHVRQSVPEDPQMAARVSIIGEGHEQHVRMAHLAIVGSHKVNGVSRLHAELMRSTVFADFHRLFPDRILAKTNGITPRRWLRVANPKLSELITSRIGEGWETHLDRLEELLPLADDPDFQEAFRAVKRANKERLAMLIHRHLRIEVDPSSIYDLQVKRIHEYKRQLLNILGLITRYNRIRSQGGSDMVPRTVIFAGKAAPSYFMAKRVIKLVNDVASVINSDPATAGLLRVVFIPNYDISTAEDLIPAADLSEQISTAGTEASGTGNMKLALNGALTIGTRDGANVEIGEAVGEENIFFFGLTKDEVARLRAEGGYDPWACYHEQQGLRESLDMVRDGHFSTEDRDRYRCIFDALTSGGDPYMVLGDFAAYMDCQQRVETLYRDPTEWTRRAIINIAKMGRFSCDRMVSEYAEDIWKLKPAGSSKSG
jgi:starch phosphorylase